ncbi:alpha/beta hydrolase [Cohnella sp. WQ 127256]|uniref:alpha/beta hydrolase n=1 Tax=Cohnella sp. WQ 127256 TaxID=2938790 RepID=UPI0021194732|nr:alpha/beta hydrolase-fold protein [Cohnella sp. WQ 127256]
MIIKPYVKPNYETMLITNKTNDLSYEIFIAKPSDEPAKDGYGVIYVLDGNGLFETAAEITRLLTRKPKGYPPAIVVGIGYPGGEAFDTVRRIYDLTMPAELANLPQRPNGEPWPEFGGADELLSFFENDLMPAIDQKYVIDKQKQALFGHSLGGLFVLHALYSQSPLFSHYIASSSSIWWNHHAIVNEFEVFKAKLSKSDLSHVLRTLMIVGGDELEYMVKDSLDLCTSMMSLHIPSLEVSWALLEQEDHVSVISGAISRAVKFMLTTSSG